ncbi:MAG TPA: hypothetical protein VFQ30_12165 [Ktedonobacteraceae bacterium]|nr:hypothetical protein [Ktedonobacteraceae bacterium]
MLKTERIAESETPFTAKRRFPLYGFAALALCLLAWAASWLRIDPLYRYSFFPLWFGYIVFMDALVTLRRGTSLLNRARWRTIQLFLISSVFWWAFEGMNIAVQNWHYILDRPYGPLAYFLIASLNFSTVLPAVMETAEFLSSFKPLHPRLPANTPGPRLPLRVTLPIIFLGLLCLLLPWIFPRYCFVLIWLCMALILDPINNILRRKSALAHIAVGDWHFIALPLAGLCCGFFWEMWNYYALPKWYYTIPYVGFWKIFEMPLLGYTGYLPFALELFAMYQFVLFLARQKEDFLAI